MLLVVAFLIVLVWAICAFGDGRNGLTGTAETLRRMEYF